MLNIKILQGDDFTMKRLLVHGNLPLRHVLYLDRVVMHSKTTEFVDIPSPLHEQNSSIH